MNSVGRLAAFVAIQAVSGATLGAPLIQVDPFAPDSIRIRVAPPGAPSIADPPLQALLTGDDLSLVPPVPAGAVARGSPTELTNGNLKVVVDPATGFLEATRVSDGTPLLTQTALVFGEPDVPATRPHSASVSATFGGTAGERIYGLGEHRTGVVNQMPYTKRFADSQDYGKSHGSDVSIPWYASSVGYGFLWNSAGYGSVSITEKEITWTTNASLGFDVWITTTPASFDAATTSPYAPLLSNYVDAVGHASTMPYYSTGFIQCKDRYRNQSQLLDVARGYVERQLPISVIVIDWKHWVAQGDWHFNPACWPDPQGMFDELQRMGIELMVTFWPFQSTESRHWDEFTSNGYLANVINATKPTSYDGGNQYLVDQTNPATRKAVFNGFMEGYGTYGIKTIWIDAAEPEHNGASMEGTWKLQAGTDAEVGEAWVTQHARSFHDGFASVNISASDYFILPRHAWVGSWRYSAALWSGDIVSTFDELALQVKVLQGVMMSGVALWTTDIGGYEGGNPSDPVFQELIVRWFQFGAFCPLFRLHGHRGGGPPSNECGPTNGDNEVWNLAQGMHYQGIVTMMHLREQLREYVAQANAEHAATGFPIVRPMFLQYPNDPNCQGLDVEDQYMFGSDWLVAPVVTYQATNRSVYLPKLNASAEWVYYFNFSSVGQGGARYDVDTTKIEEFPLFFIRPVTPVALANATSFWSAERSEQVLCLSAVCYQANGPGQAGDYVAESLEGRAIATHPEENPSVGGSTYPTVPLYLYFSKTHNDNIVSTKATPPDDTYSIAFDGGYAFASPPPGSRMLQYFLKTNGSSWDYATVANPASAAEFLGKGYSNVTLDFPIRAYVL